MAVERQKVRAGPGAAVRTTPTLTAMTAVSNASISAQNTSRRVEPVPAPLTR
jgi:hypothetical protein